MAWSYELVYFWNGVAGVGMKRSEMIRKLASQILVGDVDLWLYPAEAEAILDRLEELGMRPPITNINESVRTEDWVEEDGKLKSFTIIPGNE